MIEALGHTDRQAFSWLRERDIDLLLCSELHARADLLAAMASVLSCGGATLTSAWVSHMEVEGESDLVIVLGHEGERVIVLAENKIAAGFQPDQADRYSKRARRWKEAERCRVATLLIAPEAYFLREGAELFDHRLSYEKIGASLRASADPRSRFLADCLDEGVRSYQRGYVMNPNETVSAAWQRLWAVAQDVSLQLAMKAPNLKPGQSTWIYFYDAEGFEDIDWRRAIVAYKAERGQVDLQFGKTTVAQLTAATEGLLDTAMTVQKASGSASIRLRVPAIDFHSSEDQTDRMRLGLEASERMRAFFLENKVRLLSTTGGGAEVTV